MKSKDLQPRLLYPAKLSFRIKRQIKSFLGKRKLKEFIITKPVLYEMLNGLKNTKKDKKYNNKMAINTYLSTKSKTKINEQAQQKQTHSYREHFHGC